MSLAERFKMRHNNVTGSQDCCLGMCLSLYHKQNNFQTNLSRLLMVLWMSDVSVLWLFASFSLTWALNLWPREAKATANGLWRSAVTHPLLLLLLLDFQFLLISRGRVDCVSPCSDVHTARVCYCIVCECVWGKQRPTESLLWSNDLTMGIKTASPAPDLTTLAIKQLLEKQQNNLWVLHNEKNISAGVQSRARLRSDSNQNELFQKADTLSLCLHYKIFGIDRSQCFPGRISQWLAAFFIHTCLLLCAHLIGFETANQHQ